MPYIQKSSYSAPIILANSHVSTVLPFLFRRVRKLNYQRERLETPDGDFLDIDWSRKGSRHLAIVLHGLAGNSYDTYVMGMVKAVNNSGFDAIAINMRGCSGEPNRLEKFFSPGDLQDIDLVVQHGLRTGRYDSVHLIGFSMGASVFLLYLGKHPAVPDQVRSCVTFSAPLDLGSTADHLSKGPQRLYMKRFLSRYRTEMRRKEKMRPGTFDLSGLDKIQSFRQFDTHYCCRWHGYSSVEDFYQDNSALPYLQNIRIPTLIVNAKNDPFLPEVCYPTGLAEKLKNVYLEIPDFGGHVGFFTFARGGGFWSEARAAEWILAHI